jgi:nicotinate-nucleotide--dimethylbenzimidazole phosphoribosyltransferase
MPGVARKADAVTRALHLHARATPLRRLAAWVASRSPSWPAPCFGAQRRKVVLIDGFIVTSALLVAAALQPAVLEYCVFRIARTRPAIAACCSTWGPRR